jgi:hypothetical protein
MSILQLFVIWIFSYVTRGVLHHLIYKQGTSNDESGTYKNSVESIDKLKAQYRVLEAPFLIWAEYSK